jgi:ABC-2 type transport system ATP-binding protein
MDKLLEIKHLKKYYGNIVGVEDVTLTLKPGEIYGFIGPNGAGKSTTIRTIMGLINKNEGKIFFNGEELNIDNPKVKAEIGYLPSEVNLYGNMLVKELLDYHESFYKKDTHKKRTKLVKLLKIDETKRVEDLSLGNLKKIGIVLALMHSPKLLILDEPTSGLDPIMQKVFIDFVIEEKKRGKTILLSSHIFSEVDATCDTISIIKDGKHVSTFKANDLKNSEQQTYILYFLNKENLDLYMEKGKQFKIKNINEHSLTAEVEFNKKDYKLFFESLSGIKIKQFVEKPFTLQDYFMSFYKEEKEFGGLSGVKGNSK